MGNNCNTQIIEEAGKPKYAVIPYQIFLKMQEDLEMLSDIRDFNEAITKKEETFPAELVDKILDGENKIKIFREYRQLSQEDLAKQVGVTKQYISQLESGKRKGAVSKLKKIAETLGLEIDDIL